MDELSCNQTITIHNGKVIEINQVIEILSFDDSTMILNTSKGRITIEGNELKIQSLEKRDGNLYATGDIYGVYYSEGEGNKKSFWSSIFGR